MIRDQMIPFRTTRSEKSKICNAADAQRLSVSDYCRNVTLKEAGYDITTIKRKPHPSAEELRQFRILLNRIAGSPLNQLAKWVQTHKKTPHESHLIKIAGDLSKLKRKIEQELR